MTERSRLLDTDDKVSLDELSGAVPRLYAIEPPLWDALSRHDAGSRPSHGVEHRNAVYRGFSADYGVYRLVWMEDYERIVDAIAREKELKKWRRDWKIALIEKDNPNWDDLFGG